MQTRIVGAIMLRFQRRPGRGQDQPEVPVGALVLRAWDETSASFDCAGTKFVMAGGGRPSTPWASGAEERRGWPAFAGHDGGTCVGSADLVISCRALGIPGAM